MRSQYLLQKQDQYSKWYICGLIQAILRFMQRNLIKLPPAIHDLLMSDFNDCFVQYYDSSTLTIQLSVVLLVQFLSERPTFRYLIKDNGDDMWLYEVCRHSTHEKAVTLGKY